jgi:hypothetical protein
VETKEVIFAGLARLFWIGQPAPTHQPWLIWRLMIMNKNDVPGFNI